MNINVYLDWNCGGCEEYLKTIKNWCKVLEYSFTLLSVDDDPVCVFNEIKRLRSEGHIIEYFPVCVIKNDKYEHTYYGILEPETLNDIFSNL